MTPKPFGLADRLRAGDSCYMAWIGLPGVLAAETIAREAFDAVCFDMQHSSIGLGDVMPGLSAVNFAGKPGGVRLALDDFGTGARVLDVGAEFVIAPMINSAADARRFAAAIKYPPLGERSWGGPRAMQLTGMAANDYLAFANAGTLAFAMIETKAALAAVDEILAVPGIDGVFAGPSDLSITLLEGKRIDPTDPIVDGAFATILAAAKRAGKLTGCYAPSLAAARACADAGWGLITLINDTALIRLGAQTALAATKA